MFTLEQIKNAHAKVKSGADFPKYIQELQQLGVVDYETFVSDGHTIFKDKENRALKSESNYASLVIADKSDRLEFQKKLQEHQQGKTNYPTFCEDCARLGVEKWMVDINKMTCTYYDKAGQEMLLETIPSI